MVLAASSIKVTESMMAYKQANKKWPAGHSPQANRGNDASIARLKKLVAKLETQNQANKDRKKS